MKKEHIKHALEAYLPELTAMADQIYDLAEPGMEEFQSSKLLADYLQNQQPSARFMSRERAARPSGF